MTESMQFSLGFAAIGIVIVFTVLAVITAIVTLIRRADKGWQDKEEKRDRDAYEKDQNIDTVTLILIAAAAATAVGGRFHIRRVRRLMPTDAIRGPWSAQGRAILHGSHVVTKRDKGRR